MGEKNGGREGEKKGGRVGEKKGGREGEKRWNWYVKKVLGRVQ